MHVRCPQCGAVYDFDEARIPAEGVSVKCSQCAHVFRVAAPQEPLRPPEAHAAPGGSPAFLAPSAPAWSPATSPAPSTGDRQGGSMDGDYYRPGPSVARVLGFALVLAGVGAGVYLYLLQPQAVERWTVQLRAYLIPQEAQDAVATGFVDLRKDTAGALERALARFKQARVLSDAYADAAAGLALVHVDQFTHRQELRRLRMSEADEPEASDANAPTSDSVLARAEVIAQDALRLDPQNHRSHRAMAAVYIAQGKAEAARHHTDTANQLAPDRAANRYWSGRQLQAAGDLPGARRAFEAALTQDPSFVGARYWLATTLIAQKETDSAQTALQAVLERSPKHGRAALRLKALSEPVAVAAPPEPDAPPPPPTPSSGPGLTPHQMIIRAERYRDTDRPELALQLYERALEGAPRDPDIHTGMGWSYLDLEEYTLAVSSFRRALRLAPRLTEAHMGLGDAFRQKGLKRDALRHYRAYLDILPNGPEAAVARRMIRELR